MTTRDLSKPSPEGDARRVPLQDRSRQRVVRILDAAALVFLEMGFEAATTEAIAARAGTSIGSLYQFFPNKLAVFNAIAASYLEKCIALFDDLVKGALDMPWEEVIDRAVDVFSAVNQEPGFRAVWTNWQLSAEFLVAGEALNREFAKRTESILAARAASMAPAQRALVATVVIEVMSSMMLLTARRAEVNGAQIAAETKTLLRRYLSGYVEPSPSRSRSRSGSGSRSRSKAKAKAKAKRT